MRKLHCFIFCVLICFGCKKEVQQKSIKQQKECDAGGYLHIKSDEQGRIVSFGELDGSFSSNNYHSTVYNYIGDSLIIGFPESKRYYSAKLNSKGFIEKEYYNYPGSYSSAITSCIYDSTDHLIREETANYDSAGTLLYTWPIDYEWENGNLKYRYPNGADNKEIYTEYQYYPEITNSLKNLEEKLRMKGTGSAAFISEKIDWEYEQIKDQISYRYASNESGMYCEEKRGAFTVRYFSVEWPCK